MFQEILVFYYSFFGITVKFNIRTIINMINTLRPYEKGASSKMSHHSVIIIKKKTDGLILA